MRVDDFGRHHVPAVRLRRRPSGRGDDDRHRNRQQADHLADDTVAVGDRNQHQSRRWWCVFSDQQVPDQQVPDQQILGARVWWCDWSSVPHCSSVFVRNVRDRVHRSGRGILARRNLTDAGSDTEPRRAILITALISQAAVLVADLNTIAPLITMAFLVTYALLNLATFYEAITKNQAIDRRSNFAIGRRL